MCVVFYCLRHLVLTPPGPRARPAVPCPPMLRFPASPPRRPPPPPPSAATGKEVAHYLDVLRQARIQLCTVFDLDVPQPAIGTPPPADLDLDCDGSLDLEAAGDALARRYCSNCGHARELDLAVAAAVAAAESAGIGAGASEQKVWQYITLGSRMSGCAHC